MGNASTIHVGGSEKATYLAFGDDSQFGDTLVYAFAIVRRTRLTAIEARVAALKKQFGIPKRMVLHCRLLFSGQQREKAGLGHLTSHDVQSILAGAITIMNDGPVFVRYSVGNLSEFRVAIGSELEMQHESDGSTMKLPVQMDPKGLLGMLMQACFAVPPDGSQGPPSSQCKIFVSADSTMVKFIGPTRRRADGMYSGFSAIGAPAGQVFQLQPTVVKSSTHPLLQLADIAAYICSHSLDDSDENVFFREQRSGFKYWSRAVFAANPALQPPR